MLRSGCQIPLSGPWYTVPNNQTEVRMFGRG